MAKVEDAKKAINENQALSKFQENCGSLPTIIGTCRVQSKTLMQIEFSLLPVEEHRDEEQQAAR